ncbi:hypothetical protein XBO1_2520006 [Xenorhabdus bovienii str. oregonense]|uniref:Uncharacterized protein n=1 Tax=Xenorhabdus bovienii str. oregonense TaxID=1398202 RepID=A0A077P7A7_XENBV|nr:hypothetical protein XBO1_2520006 [Xenorhabdus bovienii str. oregonense]
MGDLKNQRLCWLRQELIESVHSALVMVRFFDGTPIMCAIVCANLGGVSTLQTMARAVFRTLFNIIVFPAKEMLQISQINSGRALFLVS